MPRDHVRCYFGRADVQSCLTSDRKPGDPFHIEAVLVDLALPRLRTDAFSGTQHDRGHMAPNHAFGWHLCGPYKTFTMANMAAQRDYLNRIAARESEIYSQLPPNIIGRAPVSASTHAEYLPCHSLAEGPWVTNYTERAGCWRILGHCGGLHLQPSKTA